MAVKLQQVRYDWPNSKEMFAFSTNLQMGHMDHKQHPQPLEMVCMHVCLICH